MDKKLCECGCGSEIESKNKWGKSIRYVNGHQRIGKKMSEEWRLAQSERIKKAGCIPPWVKNISEEKSWRSSRNTVEYRIWSENVMLKNNGNCIMCNNVANQAHHIKNYRKYPELRHELSNGIPLCKCCHLKIHNPLQFRWGNKPIKKERIP